MLGDNHGLYQQLVPDWVRTNLILLMLYRDVVVVLRSIIHVDIFDKGAEMHLEPWGQLAGTVGYHLHNGEIRSHAS